MIFKLGHQMMKNSREGFVEILIGGLVFLSACIFIFYSVMVTNLNKDIMSSKFVLFANFQSIEGINVGSDVVLAGVKIGTVIDIELDKKFFLAKVKLALNDDYKLPDDTEAVVSSASLLGENYISLNVGGSDVFFNNGDEIIYTQSSLSILNLLGKFVSQ